MYPFNNALRLSGAMLGSLVLWCGMISPAHALPSYARQTGQDCAACHIGSFGPQLTPYGMKFKLGGYTESDGKGGHIPLSAMVLESFTHTSKDQSGDAAPHYNDNNNLSLQEVSMFVAGRFSDNIGSFIQVTHAEPDRKTSLDQMDLRFVKPLQIGGNDTVLGIDVNNNPSVQDSFNTFGAWKFPYVSSELAPTPNASTLLDGGLEQQVLGASAYAFYDNHWYAELGGYQSLGKKTLIAMNVDPGDKIKNTAPYWRLAYLQDMRKQAFSVGLFGMNADLYPGWTPGKTNNFRDVGVDGSYQFLGTREHVFALNGSYTYESRDFAADYADGGVSHKNGRLNNLSLNGSYHYDKTYGLTLGLFDITGNRDDALYNTGEADSGSIKGSPNSRGYIVQADWTPFGKEDSWGAPWANLRLGLQYTGYDRFNGASHNYDGFGRDASDNNTLYTFAWLAF